MKHDFAKLFFMDTLEEHQVLLTKENLPDGPCTQIRIDFPTGPEIKTERFNTLEDRDSAFRAFLLADAKLLFERVCSFRTSFYSEKNDVLDADA